MTTTLAKATRTFPAPTGYKKSSLLRVTAQAYQLNGNKHPHFSVTCDIGDEAGGCLHDEASEAWPKIKPIIALHLSSADDGEPMHAEANGYYWLAGVVGGLGEQYHGGSGSSAKSPDECLRILADHLRITLDDAQAIADKVKAAFDATRQGQSRVNTGKNTFHDYVNAQRDRWQAEAEAGIALIRELSQPNKE